jgi:hypothetical protein
MMMTQMRRKGQQQNYGAINQYKFLYKRIYVKNTHSPHHWHQ